MTDMDKFCELLEKNNLDFRTTPIYDTEDNSNCGRAVWLAKGGHAEFDFNGKLTNVVPY